MTGGRSLDGLQDLPRHYQVVLLAETSKLRTTRRAEQSQLVYCRAYCLISLVYYTTGSQRIQQQFLQ